MKCFRLLSIMVLLSIFPMAISLNGCQKADGGSSVVSPYYLNEYRVSAVPSYNLIEPATKKVEPTLLYDVNIGIVAPESSGTEGPVEYKVVNTKVVKKPRHGNVVFCEPFSDGNIKSHIFKNGEYIVPAEGFSGINFKVVLDEIGVVYTYNTDTPLEFLNPRGVINDAGVSSGSVRCEVSFDIEVKDKDGKTYYYPLRIKMMPGNFLEDNQDLVKSFDDTNKYFIAR